MDHRPGLKRRSTLFVASGVAALALGAGLSACGSSGSSLSSLTQPSAASSATGDASTSTDSTDTSTDASTPDAVTSGDLSQADATALMTQASSSYKSAKIDMEMKTGSVGAMTMQGVEQTDPMAMDATMSISGQKIEMRMVDNVMYMQMPGLSTGGKWMKLDLSDLSKLGMGSLGSMTDPSQMIANYAKYVKSAKLVGDEQVDGVSTKHYSFTVDAKGEISSMMSGSLASQAAGSVPDTLTVDEWIDDQNRPVQISTDMGSLGTMTMKLSDFDTAVDVQAPPAADVTDMSDMLSQMGGSTGSLSGLS